MCPQYCFLSATHQGPGPSTDAHKKDLSKRTQIPDSAYRLRQPNGYRAFYLVYTVKMTSGLNPYNFTISDQSPLFQYIPFRDGPMGTSWNVTYAGDPDSTWAPDTFIGAGQSSHRTTLAGASARLDWTRTAVYLYGEASSGGYTITLDGSQTNALAAARGLLYSQSGIDYGAHTLILEVVQGEVTILNGFITVGMGNAGTTVQNHTIATTTVPLAINGFVLSGGWSTQPYTYSTTGTPAPRIGTTTQGASISLSLTSTSAFYILGSVNYNHGAFVVTVSSPSDPGSPKVGHYNGSSRWMGLDAMLYLETGMVRSQTYQIQVMNDSPSLWLDIGQIVVLDTPPSSSPSPTPSHSNPSSTNSSSATESMHALSTGTIAGIAIAGLVGLLAVLILIMLCIQRWRHGRFSGKHNSFPAECVTPSYTNPAFVEDHPSAQPGVPYGWSPTSLMSGGVDFPAWNTGVLPSPISASVLPPSLAYVRNSPVPAPVEAWRTPPHHPPTAVPSRSSRAEADNVLYITPSASLPLSSATLSSHLTDEQAELVQRLLRHNVPVNTIAGVVERLFRGEGQSGVDQSSHMGDSHADDDAPPGYDFKSTTDRI